MKRILTLALILAVIWGIGYLYATDVNFYEFRGGVTKSGGQNWLSATDRFYAPLAWYDTTASDDELVDTMHSSTIYLGSGTLEKLVFKYSISTLDSFSAMDSLDTLSLQFQFSNTDSFTSTWLWTYAVTGIVDTSSSYTTIASGITDAETLLTYPGYNYARCRLIYQCVWDSASWEEECTTAAADNFTKHVPVTLNTAYYPIWK